LTTMSPSPPSKYVKSITKRDSVDWYNMIIRTLFIFVAYTTAAAATDASNNQSKLNMRTTRL
jgi:hypothetical protein